MTDCTERGEGREGIADVGTAMTADGLPQWWEPLLSRVRAARTEDFTRLPTPEHGGRASAVLVLLGEQGHAAPAGDGRRPDPDVLMLQRAATLRTHAGQPAFPGGASEPGDPGPAGTALREAEEEVGLDPASVTVVAQLPRLWIPVSGFVVTPVLAWWHRPHGVHPRQPEEVAHVARLPVSELVDPANRMLARHPSGWIGPAFQVRGMMVWGFTAGVLSALLDMAGWSVPWSRDRVCDLPPTSVVAGPSMRPGPVGGPGAERLGEAAGGPAQGPPGTPSTMR